MSSFLGHTVAAFTAAKTPKSARWSTTWFLWLTVLASAPDVDYLFPEVHLGAMRYRISHSLLGALLLPAFTAATLSFVIQEIQLLRRMVLQAFAAGLSHLLLDLLVGVTPLPLFWPFASQRIRLPFGILPSAGSISFANVYLYRNTLIEVGVLAPLSALIIWKGSLKLWQQAGLGALSSLSMAWAYSLPR